MRVAFTLRPVFFYFLIITVVLLWIAVSLYSGRVSKAKVLTMDDLPTGIQYIEHEHEHSEVEEAEQVSMAHYATPEAFANGGPIFGVAGYRIISIEYEFRSHDSPTKTVGKEFGGYILNIPGYENIDYNHFHISSHEDGQEEPTNNYYKSEIIYSIHFMLIPHEEELNMRLACG